MAKKIFLSDIQVDGTISRLGGLAKNFLKEDGSIDTTSYLPASGGIVSGDIIPDIDNVHSLGSPSKMWRDVYIGPGSLYINGKKVIEDVSDTMNITTSLDQNLSVKTSGTGTLQIQSVGSGNIELSAMAGLIQMKGSVMFQAGKLLRSSDGSSLLFDDDIKFSAGTGIDGALNASGNITAPTFIGNLTGKSSSTFLWDGQAYKPTTEIASPQFIMTYDSVDSRWAPALPSTVKALLGITGNYLPLTGGNISGTVNFNSAPLVLNDSYLQIKRSGTARALLGSSSFLTGGGSETDFNTYLYGSDPYGIWTNGTKRFSVNGDGNVEVLGGSLKLNGDRPITINAGTGSILFKFPSTPFAMGTFFNSPSDATQGAFGAYGSGSSIEYHYIGADYSNPLLKIYNNGNTEVKGTLSATSFLGTSTKASRLVAFDSGNDVFWGWDGQMTLQINGTNFGRNVPMSISGGSGYATYSGHFPTAYNGGDQPNPQTYFNENIGLKVAMTRSSWLGNWSDTLWINGYSGTDVPQMSALHFIRNGTPRMWISAQSNRSTSYGEPYEVLTAFNYSSFALPASGSYTRPGTLTMYSNDTSGSYSTRALELREVGVVTTAQTSSAYSPAIGFHWGGLAQAQIAMRANGIMVIRDNPGDGFAIVHENNISLYDIRANGGRVNGLFQVKSNLGGNYNEGIRIENNANNWANIQFGTDSTNAGLNSNGNQWLLGKNPDGNFQICKNGSNVNSGIAIGNTGIWFNNNLMIHAGNIGSYAVLSAGQSTWAGAGVRENVVGMLSWRNYGNGHVIFDASQSASPSGTAVGNTDSQQPWNPTYPTLMGWNGDSTYGVRVDTARVSGWASSAGSAPNADNTNNYYHVTPGEGYGIRFWGSDNYRISMGVSSLYKYGPVSDYSIKMNMDDSTPGRGFTWGRMSSAPIAALNATTGEMKIAGQMIANDFRVINNVFLDQQVGSSIIGLYDPGRYQGLFSMGSAYAPSIDGTSLANHYGLAWTHTNAGGQSKPGLSHQLLVTNAGATQTALGVGIWTIGNITSLGTGYFSGDVIAYYSDERLKTKLGSVRNAIDKVKSLSAFYYANNHIANEKGFKDSRIQFGLSAQEVQRILPEVVTLAPFDTKNNEDGSIQSLSGENYLTVNYAKIVPLLVEAIKEQQLMIDELRSKLN